MPITRTDVHEISDGRGNVISSQQVVVDVTAETNDRTIRSDLLTGLSQLQQIIDAAPVTFSNLAGAQTASQQMQTAIKANARQLRRLTRLALGLLDGVD